MKISETLVNRRFHVTSTEYWTTKFPIFCRSNRKAPKIEGFRLFGFRYMIKSTVSKKYDTVVKNPYIMLSNVQIFKPLYTRNSGLYSQLKGRIIFVSFLVSL